MRGGLGEGARCGEERWQPVTGRATKVGCDNSAADSRCIRNRQGVMGRANSGDHQVSESISVLICDDAADMRQLLVQIIEVREGLHVAGEAADGLEAIAEAERLQPAVILLDLSMPRMTGLDALPEIRRVAPDALVVVLSGFLASTLAADVLAQGADRYLEKGASPSLITRTIEELVSAKAPAIPPTRG